MTMANNTLGTFLLRYRYYTHTLQGRETTRARLNNGNVGTLE